MKKFMARPKLDMELVFSTIDSMISDASGHKNQTFYTLSRDKALIYLIYALAVPPEEVLLLKVDSFKKKSDAPDMGKFGILHYVANPECRVGCLHIKTTKIQDKKLVDIMSHYMKDIRPYFISSKNPALFLSTSQKRLTLLSLQESISDILTVAGIDKKKFDVRYFGLAGFDSTASRRPIAGETTLVLGYISPATTECYDPARFKDNAIASDIKMKIKEYAERRDYENSHPVAVCFALCCTDSRGTN